MVLIVCPLGVLICKRNGGGTGAHGEGWHLSNHAQVWTAVTVVVGTQGGGDDDVYGE